MLKNIVHKFFGCYFTTFLVVFWLFFILFPTETFAQKNTKISKPINKKQVFEEADAELYVQNFKEAIKLFDKYIKADTTNEQAYFKRGNAHFNLNNLEKADADFSRTLQIDTANFEAYLYKGAIFFRNTQYEMAISCFEKSLKLNFNQPVLFNYLAESHHLLGNLDTAIRYYDDIIVRFPQEMALYLGRGNCHFDKTNYRNAITDFDKVLSENPRNVEVLRKRAQTKFLLSDFQGVVNDLEDIESKILAGNITENNLNNEDEKAILAEEHSLKAFCYNQLKQTENSIQSISKLFTFVLALKLVGDEVWQRVGREPSGAAFNSMVQLETEKGIPRNPFINAGALVITDILTTRFAHLDIALLGALRRLSDSPDLNWDMQTAKSERDTAHRNMAMAYFMKSYGNFVNEPELVLDNYCRQCATEMSCAQLAQATMFLANNGQDLGRNGKADEQFISSDDARRVNALLLTCGAYDAAGDFAYRIGLPVKTGVGGGIVAIAPGIGTIAVWSPELDAKGNSVLGAFALERLVQLTGWHTA